VKCIARKSEITLNQSVVIRDYDTVAWVKSALASCNAMRVKFPLRQSIVVSLTSTASSEKMGWEAEGNGAYLNVPSIRTLLVRWTLEIGTSDYDDKGNGNVNSCKPRYLQSG
jgi:hypothetical protein